MSLVDRLSLEQYRHVNAPPNYSFVVDRDAAKTIGERVKRERLARGFTQVYLAARAGIGQSALSSIETGDTKWLRGGTLLRLAEALDVNVYWLETGFGDKDRKSNPADHQFANILQGLTPDNRHRLLLMGQALLQDQVDRRPSAANPFPLVPKPPLLKVVKRRTKKATR